MEADGHMEGKILRFKNIHREEIDDLSVKIFTGRYSGLLPYLKIVFESLISWQKSYHRRFSGFTVYNGQVIT